VSNRAARFTRRLRARRATAGHPLSDPRTGDTERRQAERRVRAMTPREVEDWLRRNGITGSDRRTGQRRQQERRR
jgi:hypothetical protein